MPMTGDFSKLNKLAAAIAKLPKTVAKAAAKAAAPDIESAIQAEFDTGTDVYGSALKADKPRTFARGTSGLFVRSGLARGSLHAKAAGQKIRVTITGYFRYHISTKGPFFPPAGGAKPPAWTDAIRPAVAKAFQDELEAA